MEEEDELEAQDEELVDDYDIFDMDYVPPPPKERNKWFRLPISFLTSIHILLYLNISFSLFLPTHSVIFFLSILYKYCLLNIFHAISITVSLYIYIHCHFNSSFSRKHYYDYYFHFCVSKLSN